MKKLKTIKLLLLFLLTMGSILTSTGQTADRFIQVGDTTINLNDVDLEKGVKIKGKQFVKKTDDDRLMNYKTGFKVFTSPERDYYAVVLDTIFWREGSWMRATKTVLQYFNKKNELLFEKKFMGFGLFKCYISESNEVIVISLANEDYEGYELYKIDGTLIKKYNTSKELYVGPMHRNFFICSVEGDSDSDFFDHIDESGNIEKVVFPQGFIKGIEFSPQENYYLVSLDDQQLLYDMNHKLIWKEPISAGFIYFLKDERGYLLSEPSTNYIKIKDLFSHQLKYEVDSVIYKRNKIPIYRSFLLNGDFYVIGKNDSIYIYNFYNERGELLQTETVPVLRKVKPYQVLKKDGRFIIIKSGINIQ